MNLKWIPTMNMLPEDDMMCLVTCRTQKGVLNVNRAYYSLAPGMWLTHAGKVYKISSQQDYDSSYFKITEMEFNPDTEEWQEYRDVNVNKYFLAGWEVYKPNDI